MTPTDPQWYTEAVAEPEAARWVVHVEECVQWVASADARATPSEASYIMSAALSAIALHIHRLGGEDLREAPSVAVEAFARDVQLAMDRACIPAAPTAHTSVESVFTRILATGSAPEVTPR